MVKIYGPMMSLDASGTLAGAVTFSKWKGRNYARQRVIPANPKSGDQVGRRAMFKFLTQAWAANSPARKATWQDLADQLLATPFNAFLSDNMQRWHNFLTPSLEPNPPEETEPSDNQITAAAYEQNRIKLSIVGSTLAHAWGIVIFAAEGATITPAVGNCILVKPDTTIAAHAEYWTPPKVQKYTFKSIAFSGDGKQIAAGPPVTATPP